MSEIWSVARENWQVRSSFGQGSSQNGANTAISPGVLRTSHRSQFLARVLI